MSIKHIRDKLHTVSLRMVLLHQVPLLQVNMLDIRHLKVIQDR